MICAKNPKGLYHEVVGVGVGHVLIADIQPVPPAPPNDRQHGIDTAYNTAMGCIRTGVKMPFKVARDTGLKASFICVQEAAAKPLHKRL
jgi:hypothetical protein